MSWSKEWPNKILHVGELSKTVSIDPATLVAWPEVTKNQTIDIDKLVALNFATGDWADVETEKVYNNLSPTHDPYTNPNAQIYYQCGCGAILDPCTKSFAALNNCASEKGWKIRFGETGYTPYCVKCGEGSDDADRTIC